MELADTVGRLLRWREKGEQMSDPEKKAIRITNFKSFEEITGGTRQIAGLYFYQMTDCLVELAWKVSVDFRKRPQLYRCLGDSVTQEGGKSPVALLLLRLNSQYGTEIDVLSKAQREAIYLPLFGSSPWSPPLTPQVMMPVTNVGESFPRLRDSLIRAATAFAERPVETLVNMLKENVVQAHRPFKDYLVYLHGDSVRFSEKVLEDMTERICYPIFRSDGVADVFGISDCKKDKDDEKGAGEYPYATDPAEDALVEEISRQLQSIDNSQTNITREYISNLQRVALRGTEAIAAVIDFEESTANHEDLELLITRCYTWGTALANLNNYPKMATSPPPTTTGPPTTGGPPTTAHPSPPATTGATTPATSTKAPAGYAR